MDEDQATATVEIIKLGGTVEFSRNGHLVVKFLGPNITDTGLEHLMEHLKGLTHLESLEFKGTRVTRETVTKLERALPMCDIYFEVERVPR